MYICNVWSNNIEDRRKILALTHNVNYNSIYWTYQFKNYIRTTYLHIFDKKSILNAKFVKNFVSIRHQQSLHSCLIGVIYL